MDIEMPVQAIYQLQLCEARIAIVWGIRKHWRRMSNGMGKLKDVCSWHTRYYRGVDNCREPRSDIHAKDAKRPLSR